jgi:hypothetical protein
VEPDEVLDFRQSHEPKWRIRDLIRIYTGRAKAVALPFQNLR